jgi:HPr kinase/phosphorylase
VTSPVLMHASCVAVSDRAVLITGPSGAGKSSLALALLAIGAGLVSDDQTEIFLQEGRVFARCPNPALAGLIEARGVGLLAAAAAPPCVVELVVDLATPEPDRLPPRRKVTLLGQPVDLVLGHGNDHLFAAVLCYLKGTRRA